MLFRKYFVHAILFFFLFFVNSSLSADTLRPYSPHYPEPSASNDREPNFTEANAEAMHWLNLIDQFQYGPSWLDSGALFRDIITQEQWIAAMTDLRTPLGTLRTRKLAKYTETNRLTFGTEGHFMIITYRSEYSKRANAVEEVILKAEDQLQLWKVIHYQINISR